MSKASKSPLKRALSARRLRLEVATSLHSDIRKATISVYESLSRLRWQADDMEEGTVANISLSYIHSAAKMSEAQEAMTEHVKCRVSISTEEKADDRWTVRPAGRLKSPFIARGRGELRNVRRLTTLI